MIPDEIEVLALRAGEEIGRYVLGPGSYTIGRSSECDLRIQAESVSRQHARLTFEPTGTLLIQDIGSANGTFLDELPVGESSTFSAGQTISIGAARLRIQPRLPSDSEAFAGTDIGHDGVPAELRQRDRYAAGDELARGGMGAIIQAREVATRRTVAMKVMLPEAEASARHRLRFIEEAQITAQLEHPNIVPVHELGIDGTGRVFYTMKLVKGITLKKVLELLGQGTPAITAKYPLPALLTIFQKVCDAVAFAHSKGVIHRDLKPANIMVGGYGEVLVMDWGLAKLAKKRGADGEVIGTAVQVSGKAPALVFEELVQSARQDEGDAFSTLQGSVMGTPHYMAPEQARGDVDQLDARTDIFALGAILYQILTLRLPFPGKTVREVLEKVMTGQPVPPRKLIAEAGVGGKKATAPAHLPGGQVPDSLSAVAVKALAHLPTSRYQTVKNLQDDLLAYQNGFATSAESASLRRHLTLFLKRHRAVSLAALGALVVCGAAFGAVQFRQHQVRDQQRRELLEAAARASREGNGDLASSTALKALILKDDPEARQTALTFLLAAAKDDLQRERFGGAAIKLQEMLRLSPENKDAARMMPHALGEGFLSVSAPFEAEIVEVRSDGMGRVQSELSRGQLPLRDRRLRQGFHQFEIRRDGKRWCSLPVNIGRGGAAVVEIPLSEIPAGYEYVHAGEFVQGDEGTVQADGYIGKRTRSIPGFFIRSTLVTAEEYFRFRESAEYAKLVAEELKAEGLEVSDIQSGAQSPSDLQAFKEATRDVEFLPIRGLSHYEARALAKWAGARLPTEEEWEKAARGIDGRIFTTGDNPPAAQQARLSKPLTRDNSSSSPFGCFALTEAVWQWTSSLSEPDSIRYITKGGPGFGLSTERKPARRKAMDPKARYHAVGLILCRDLPAKK